MPPVIAYLPGFNPCRGSAGQRSPAYPLPSPAARWAATAAHSIANMLISHTGCVPKGHNPSNPAQATEGSAVWGGRRAPDNPRGAGVACHEATPVLAAKRWRCMSSPAHHRRRRAICDFQKKLRSQVVNRTSHIARRFRSTLPRFAEWCAANGEKKGEMGGGEERAVAGTFSLAAHLPPCSLRQAPPFRGERSEQAESPASMPDYDIDNENRLIGVTVYGKMLDEKYSTLLKNNNTLTLKECIWLDAVQKKRPLTKQAIDHLRSRNLVEGRGKDLTISLGVARLTHQVGQYTRNKGLAYDALKKLILQLAYNAGKDGFKLSDAFEGVEHALPYGKTPKAKKDYLGRILAKIAREDLIFPNKRTWYITSKGESEIRM